MRRKIHKLIAKCKHRRNDNNNKSNIISSRKSSLEYYNAAAHSQLRLRWQVALLLPPAVGHVDVTNITAQSAHHSAADKHLSDGKLEEEEEKDRLIHYVGFSALGLWHADGTAIQSTSKVCSLNPQNTKITHWICKAIPHRARRFPSKAEIAGSTRTPPTPTKGVHGRVHRAMRPNSRFLVKEPCQDEHPF